MNPRFLCASADAARIARLTDALAPLGEVMPAGTDAAQLVRQAASVAPAVLFVDFETPVLAQTLAAALQHAFPALPIVALGPEHAGDIALAAMRAGARDLIDIDRSADAAARVADIVGRLLAQPLGGEATASASASARRGKLTVLLGARAGAGVSTLAANLAVRLHRRLAARNEAAALLDLGLPAADSTLMLDTRSELHFPDAVHNLRRFDETFVHTAFARHASGLALMTLPADLAQMRTISYDSAVRTLERLRAFFDHQIVDLGGFSNLEFVSHVVEAADTVWLVCDANVTSAVSAANLVTTLAGTAGDEAGKRARRPELIVNKHDPTCHLAADELAARLALPLAATLPARMQALVRAINQGRLLAETASTDPYVRAVDGLVTQLAGEAHTRSAIQRIAARFLKRGAA
jgi:pilus assembly protein CpaE